MITTRSIPPDHSATAAREGVTIKDTSVNNPAAHDDSIAVLSVDDNALIGDVAALLVRALPGFRYVGHFLNDKGVIEAIRNNDVRVVLLDYEIPGVNTIELLREIVSSCPLCRVMMLSAHARPEIVQATRRAGASGYTTKDAPSAEIIENLRLVARGEQVFAA